ncbi:MAG: hypothetical protein GWN58_41105, partial [Anaerolineae bacterium]|nr:hypothetical protein [Thermoplasmata archaeon]NIV35629.1 hypothetical protein [Anaerolineae bacterium]NIY05870.1 hypothetical protein [Thermoplasmata archaeon]
TNVRPWAYEGGTLEGQLARDEVLFAGNIGLVEGEGSFDDAVIRVTALALDNGSLPAWAAEDGAAMDLLYLAQSQGKSNEWLMDQLIKLPSFRARFPGLEKFKTQEGLSTEDAVTAFLEYESGVKKALDMYGFNGDAMHPTMVSALIDNNYNLEAITDAVKTFKRMNDFQPAMEAFNQVLIAKGINPLTSQADLFQFMKGESPVEYYEAYEASSIQEAANVAGLGDVFTAQDAISAALQGDFTLQSASEGMVGASRLL